MSVVPGPLRPGVPALDAAFFARSVVDVARDLIGCRLTAGGAGGLIIETEAYSEEDPASHSFRGCRGRARVMFGPPGTVYVYRSYGLHWCLNLVCEPQGRGSAVLIRALAPMEGLGQMRRRRAGAPERRLCAGPGRLTQALAVDGSFNGAPGVGPRARLDLAARTASATVVAGPRVGIRQGVERPWRFGLAGSALLSRPMPFSGADR